MKVVAHKQVFFREETQKAKAKKQESGYHTLDRHVGNISVFAFCDFYFQSILCAIHVVD